jgi:hypothetical protein
MTLLRTAKFPPLFSAKRQALLLAFAAVLAAPAAADELSEAAAHRARAQIMLSKGSFASARDEAVLATWLDEADAGAWWVLAAAEKSLGHADKERRAIEKARELDPQGPRPGPLRAALEGAIAPSGAGRVMDSFAQYVAERDREDRVAGQGSASLKDHGGDRTQAERAARRAALASLAEAMKVRISVISQAGASSSDDSVTTSTEELSQAVLNGLESRIFDSFPLQGQVTVLTWMDREKYLQLLEREKVIRHDSEWSVAPRFGVDSPPCFGRLGEGNLMQWGLEVSDGPWVLGGFGVNGPFVQSQAVVYGTNASGPSWGQGHLNGSMAEAGWDWIPTWTWHRFQPYVPLRGRLLQLALQGGNPPANGIQTPPGATLYGVSAGIGFHWWGSDLFALELQVDYGIGLNQASILDADGLPFVLSDGSSMGPASLDGLQIRAGIRVGWL